MEKDEIQQKLYRKIMLTALGTTRAVSRANLNVPTKWLTFLESVRASSDLAFAKLSEMDEEAVDEVLAREEVIERRLGKRKFYDPEELEELKEKQDEIDFPTPKF